MTVSLFTLEFFVPCHCEYHLVSVCAHCMQGTVTL